MANMLQLKMLEDLDGFLLVDKPVGISFSTVVKTVKRKFGLVKVGHGGSIDAQASGLLVLALGSANKFTDRVMGGDRAYEGTIRFGMRTDTGDVLGRPVGETSAVAAVDAGKLEAALPEFRGDVFQVEPQFCTIRKEGTAAYEIADTGEHKPFLAHVYRFDVAADGTEAVPPGASAADGTVAVPPGVARFTLRASKGIIPRALVRDLGDALGCGAALESVRRTAVGCFDVRDAVPFDRLLETGQGGFPALVKPIAGALARPI